MRPSRSNFDDLSGGRVRGGVITLELILAFPILIIVLLAVVEFGLILAAGKHVEFSSRLGAKIAAESTATDIESLNQPPTVDDLKEQIDEYLATAGYTESCQVILEHNVMGASNPLQENPVAPADCPCGPTGPTTLPSQFPEVGAPDTEFASVRVTVCLPMEGNIPNCLGTFGVDLEGCTIQHSTIWRFETGCDDDDDDDDEDDDEDEDD